MTLMTTSSEQVLEDLGFETISGGLPRFLGSNVEEAIGSHQGLSALRDQTQWCEGAIASQITRLAQYGDAACDEYAGKIGMAPSTVRSWRAVWERYAAMATDQRERILGYGVKLTYTHFREAHEMCEWNRDLERWLKEAHDKDWTAAEMQRMIFEMRKTRKEKKTPEPEPTTPPEPDEKPPGAKAVDPWEILQEERAFWRTIVAGLVYVAADALGDDPYEQQVVIPRELVEDPPEFEPDDDPTTGDWIYRLCKSDAGATDA